MKSKSTASTLVTWMAWATVTFVHGRTGRPSRSMQPPAMASIAPISTSRVTWIRGDVISPP